MGEMEGGLNKKKSPLERAKLAGLAALLATGLTPSDTVTDTELARNEQTPPVISDTEKPKRKYVIEIPTDPEGKIDPDDALDSELLMEERPSPEAFDTISQIKSLFDERFTASESDMSKLQDALKSFLDKHPYRADTVEQNGGEGVKLKRGYNPYAVLLRVLPLVPDVPPLLKQALEKKLRDSYKEIWSAREKELERVDEELKLEHPPK